MKKSVRKLLTSMLVAAQVGVMTAPAAFAADAPPAPEAWGPTPNAGQMKYYKDELAGFIHFGVNQYTGREWGNGQEDPNIFQPSKLDTDQWIKAFQAAGIKRALLTAKHHDGFALYPTEYSSNKHSVESSSWKDGKGDVVQEFVNSCKNLGMDVGFYLSPWDQGNPEYNKNVGRDYNDIYIGQMNELFNYAKEAGVPVVEFWMDGACGNIATRPTYDIARWWNELRTLNPDITFQQNYGAPLRWVGNESGYASDESWQTMDYDYVWNLYKDQGAEDAGYLHVGEPYIKGEKTKRGNDMEHMVWSIPEVDVSICSGWFGYGGSSAPKSPETLAQMYFDSVGLGSPFLLNVPPNKDGLFDERYVQTLKEFGDIIRNTFDENLAAKAPAEASAVRGDHPNYGAAKATDGDYDTYWTMDDGQTTGSVTVDLGKPTLMDVIEIQEYIPLGQRISSFKTEVMVGGQWMEYGSGKTIGYKRLVKSAPVMAEKVRVTITGAYATPLINNISVYKADDRIAQAARMSPGRIEAEDFDSKSGGLISETKVPGITNIGAIGNGNYTVYKGVYFKQTPNAVRLSYAGVGSPEITLRADRVDGPVIAKVTVQPTGAYESYTTIDMNVEPGLDITGYHDVYLCLNAGLNVDSFEFVGKNILGFAEKTQTAYEGERAEVTVTRSEEDLSEEVTVTVETAPDTAVHGRHYVDKTETLTFAPGETAKTVQIETVNNEEVTGPLSFLVTLLNPSDNAVIGSSGIVKVMIQDNDQAGNMDELQEVVATANRKQESEYMPADWKAFVAVREEAEALLAQAEASQKEIDEMAAKLNKAMADMRPLQYTEENPFQLSATDAVEVEAEYMIPQGAARVTSRDGDSNGKEVEEMGLLRNGTEGYVDFYFNAPATGTYNFHMRYFTGAPNTIKWKIENGDASTNGVKPLNFAGGNGHFEEDDFVVEVKKAGLNKLCFYNDEAGTCNLDKFTISPLDVTIVDPEPGNVSKKTLEYFLGKAKEHVANGDTADVDKAVQELFDLAIAEGEAIMAKADATREEVMNATVKLMFAIHALDMKFPGADKTDLEMALEAAGEIVPNKDKYVEAGWDEFLAMKAAGEAVMADEDATQEEVDKAWNDLVEAMANLRYKADKEILKDLLDSLKDLDLSGYTEESVKAFRAAVAKAQEVLADDTLSEDEQKIVDEAVKALADAKAALGQKDDTDKPAGDKTDDGNKADDNKVNSGNSKKDSNAPKTGDNVSALWIMMLALAVGSLALVIRRKRIH